MKQRAHFGCLTAAILLTGCSRTREVEKQPAARSEKPTYFQVDAATAGILRGSVHFRGRKPIRKMIDMSGEPACVEAHHGKAYEEPIEVNTNGTLRDVFIYVKSGLEGKKFAVPSAPVTIDQQGCWFHPHVIGIQTGQELRVTNSDPVTHNIHPLAQINREWNHSQGSGDAPLARKFSKPEVMIRVKCNIHSWMRAYIGALDYPYFAVTDTSGNFEIQNLPPGEYVVEAWQEALGTQDQKVTITPAGKIEAAFHFTGE